MPSTNTRIALNRRRKLKPTVTTVTEPRPQSSNLEMERDPFHTVRLVDAETAADAGGMSVSWWYDMVKRGIAPAPVIRGVRFTRWRAADVITFWHRFAESGGDTASAEAVTHTATQANAAAAAARQPRKSSAKA